MLEEGLSILEEGIVKAKMILDGYPTSALFTAEEYMKFYEYPFWISILGCLEFVCYFVYSKVQCIRHKLIAMDLAISKSFNFAHLLVLDI